jgi:hypothetical protein
MEEGEAVAAATLAAAAGTRAEGARNTPALKVVADMKKVDATAAVVVEGDAKEAICQAGLLVLGPSELHLKIDV